MRQKNLSRYLKLLVLLIGIVCLIAFVVILPILMKDGTALDPSLAKWSWPWTIFLWGAAIPVFIALLLVYRIADTVGKDQSFCAANSHRLTVISYLAAGDGVYFLLGNVFFFLFGRSHPSILLLSLILFIAAVAVSVVAAILSHWVQKATNLQDEVTFTV